jgi:PilZ domain-containing protein
MNHFHSGQHVRLTVAELGSISGQVIEVADQNLVVSLFLNETRVVPDKIEYGDVVLEYTAVRGLYRRRGDGRFDVGGVDTMRFLPVADAELIQRRGFARVDVEVPVSVSIDDVSPPLLVDSLDLSGSGARLQPAPPAEDHYLDLGRMVWLEISISGADEPIQARGTVLRELEDGSKGVHFDYIPEHHRDRLVRFLFEHQRLMRQAGKV